MFHSIWQVDAVGNELKPVTIGTSGKLQVGQSCFAIGNPFGYENTLTTGVITINNVLLNSFAEEALY